MRKLVLFFAFVVSSMSLFAYGGTTVQESSDDLIEIEIPLVICAPEEVFSINEIFTGEDLQTIVSDLAEILDKLIGGLIPDMIVGDVLGIPDGFTILAAGVDSSLWEVRLG
ncbi:MAG: hypothetical protein LIP08_06115 [Bacteroides sp.]|nr:hypothetical protein [Bacteroides sp.]